MSTTDGFDLSIRPRRSRLRTVATVALASIGFAATTMASTILEPGFTETVIDTIAVATNGYGGMVTDNEGNLYYAANEAEQVYKVPPGGTASQFGTTAGSQALGITIIGSSLYSSYVSNDIYSQDLNQSNPTGVLIATLPSDAMGMAVVPSGFGAYGGQLAVGTNNGISIVNPSDGSQIVLWIASTNIPDVAFTLDGRLVALRVGSSELVEVSSTGVATVLASGLSAADGLAVQPATGEIYVASPNSRTIIKVQPDGSAQSVFATNVLFDGGYWPSPITFTIDGTDMYYATRESGSTIYQINGFDSAGGGIDIDITTPTPVPVLSKPGLLALILILASAGFIAIRRWSN